MHPRSIVSSCAALLACGLFGSPAWGQSDPQPVVLSPIVEQEVSSGQPFVGTVTPTRRAIVGSAVDGRVIEFPVQIGDRVEENQTLAQVLTDTISLELAAAQAELDLRQQELRELENGARPEELAQSTAQLKSAQAANKYNLARLERTKTLHERGGVTEQTLDEISSLATASEQAVLEAQASHDLIKAGPREEQIAQSRAQVAMQQAVVGQLEDQLKKHTVVAHFPGYVVAENTEAGAWVNQGDPIAEIVALDEVDVQAYVLGDAISFVRVGEEVRVEVPALADHLFTGTVVAINPQGNLQTRTFPVLVRVKNEITAGVPALKSGMIARIVLPTGPRKKAVMVPKDALVLGAEQPRVFVATKNPKQRGTFTVEPVTVTLGIAQNSMIEVIGGLKPGQQVVTLGNETLRPGDIVIPVSSNANASR